MKTSFSEKELQMISDYRVYGSLDLLESGILRRGVCRVASSLVSQRGDEAEKIIYLSGLRRAVKEKLLTAVKKRRVHLFNRRGFW